MKRKTRILILVVVETIVGITALHIYGSAPKYVPAARTAPRAVAQNHCQNQDKPTIIVSINKRHLWACEDNKETYDSPVVTGYMNNVANLTPTGTYKIYAKETDRYLKGSDDKGSWNEHVNYWMPFLYNKYGAYGFHDASWRAQSDFGKISPYSPEASHGCVELSNFTAMWLYEWAPIGTTVTIQS